MSGPALILHITGGKRSAHRTLVERIKAGELLLVLPPLAKIDILAADGETIAACGLHEVDALEAPARIETIATTVGYTMPETLPAPAECERVYTLDAHGHESNAGVLVKCDRPALETMRGPDGKRTCAECLRLGYETDDADRIARARASVALAGDDFESAKGDEVRR